MKPPAFGPNEQHTTSEVHYCGAEEDSFLGAHNPGCPYWHDCGCSTKHSSSPICHRCSCLACATAKAGWANRLGWGRSRQLELFASETG